jgi:hypothetical protein
VKDSVKDQEKLFELLTEGNSYFFWQIKKNRRKGRCQKLRGNNNNKGGMKIKECQ